jgi:hypothetical protein
MIIANTPLKAQEALVVRLMVGFVFGLGIAWLVPRLTDVVPAGGDWRLTTAQTLFAGAFVIWAGAGTMRRLSLLMWGSAALVLLWSLLRYQSSAGDLQPPTVAMLLAFLFVSHELISGADQSRRLVAPYSVYFEQTWKRGIQLGLSLLFTGLLWVILRMGATLLGFIGFDWLKNLAENRWVVWPLNGVAMAAAVQLGDVQPKLIAGSRMLVLSVLAWLLPAITAIGALFVVSLCFSGLRPLWNTGNATILLLAASAATVLLINAAYQQGDEDRPVHPVMKIAMRLACGLLLVFAVLAAISLKMRIDQYGLSPQRVFALAGVVVALFYALGYAVATVWRRDRWLEGINIGMAIFGALLFLALLTPVADPRRLSADSQAARIMTGKVAIDRADWRLLRFETGTYGRERLKALTHVAKDNVRNAAIRADAARDRDRWGSVPLTQPTVFQAAPGTLQPVPGSLPVPQSFLTEIFSIDDDDAPPCLRKHAGCQVAMIDLNDDGKAELVLDDNHSLYIYQEVSGHWSLVSNGILLDDTEDAAFRAGKVGAEKPAWNALTTGTSAHLVIQRQ